MTGLGSSSSCTAGPWLGGEAMNVMMTMQNAKTIVPNKMGSIFPNVVIILNSQVSVGCSAIRVGSNCGVIVPEKRSWLDHSKGELGHRVLRARNAAVMVPSSR